MIKKLLHRSYLQHSVIVTSRGIAAKCLYDKHFVEIRFIIQGLREDEIPVFVNYYVGGSKQNVTKVRSLIAKLDGETCLQILPAALISDSHL